MSISLNKLAPTPTAEQQAIIQHNTGPALVFAVAGAGKTTTMVSRIERLVREGVFPAKAILATSFSNATVKDIAKALSKWQHCAEVRTMTLHSLGYRLIKRAKQKGYLSDLQLKEDGMSTKSILWDVFKDVRRDKPSYYKELDSVDQDDFLNWMSAAKGNLQYPDLADVNLPKHAQEFISAAIAPKALDFYLDLYKRFEVIRRKQKLLSFDDMLLTGWEVMMRHDDILQEVRSFYQCVLVDEFQDVNLAQAEILDKITFPKRNYMAIGDDDQTIYEWRGASPRFILNFEKDYKATTFVISDNFRSKAEHLALANRVIERNKNRFPKHLNPSKGFGGELKHYIHDDAQAMAQHIAASISLELKEGTPPQDIAVLIRIYAQTAPIEAAFLQLAIPYEVVGSQPFYMRTEAVLLMHYLNLGQIEAKLLAKETLSLEEKQLAETALRGCINTPKRYISRDISTHLIKEVCEAGRSMTAVLRHLAAEHNAPKIEDFAWLLRWLAESHKSQAYSVLQGLERRIDYTNYLKSHSSFKEVGLARADEARAFISFSQNMGPVLDFLQTLDALKQVHQEQLKLKQNTHGEQQPDNQTVTFTTAFRAKGLQWPFVIIPDCNEGTFPYGEAEEQERFEEERRLFYVAITRAEQQLHLHSRRQVKLSSFLDGINVKRTSERLAAFDKSLDTIFIHYSTRDLINIAKCVADFSFERYITTWWKVNPQRKLRLAKKIKSLYSVAEAKGISEALGLKLNKVQFWKGLEQTLLQKINTVSKEDPLIDSVANDVDTVSTSEILRDLELFPELEAFLNSS